MHKREDIFWGILTKEGVRGCQIGSHIVQAARGSKSTDSSVSDLLAEVLHVEFEKHGESGS